VRESNPGVVIEVLVPDFNDRDESIETVLVANPHIFQSQSRNGAAAHAAGAFARDLRPVIERAAQGEDEARRHDLHKVRMMLGLGETEEEVVVALEDLRRAGCDILTLGQYLQPTLKHLPVVEFISPEAFDAYGRTARSLGFVHVASGPMVRSSYHADEFTLPSARH